ncbi:tumor necrosis factor ligand superfamily member 14-like [Lethenteron reissneri]|uniref:tumor necrosis factor ligand superfamily member 14-like n=1 Tax=Lethenteron reissneri TaxID=7753 RepID=UPI002AB6AF21|nr:tumor necrosis factor ligand superfamily member 14-like [Lethenteron reissneri]
MRCGGGAPCTPATWLLPVLLAGAWLCAVGVAVLAWVEVKAGVEKLHETALGKLVKTERLKLRVGQEGERLASTTPTWARDGDTERPSAHLTHVDVAARQLSRLAWSDGGAGGGVAASLRGGMRYHNGSLTVPRAGSYFVFSQIQLYHVACERVRESAHVEVVHSIRVTSTTDTTTATTATTATTTDTTTATTATTATTVDSSSSGGAATVMSTTWSPCASAGSARPTWFQSSHLGGVLHLQAGSSVAVHVTHADLVEDKREWNFFGAFLL